MIYAIPIIECCLNLYDPGGGVKSHPPPPMALTHLIPELHYCALGPFPKKNSLTPCGQTIFLIGSHDLAVRGVLKFKVEMIFILFRESNMMLEIVDSWLYY